MTVLGKVAVPKPINLPSQRLENHGLDPNVEIVPKGTLSWGSRPSSAGSNAWGTSSLSPHTDGSSSSPRHFAGRPSSGGGTRPSTAGSERACDPSVSAWGSNSRPSSASGILASNSSSLTSSRPRSAETRPGSSQLSRFAEPSAESSAPRASNATSERMGVATAVNDEFSLSSGDFPTLGSEKDESGKNTEALDCIPHGSPGSSSGRVTASGDNVGTAHGDEISKNPDFKGNSWRKDGPPYVEDGPRPGIERWRGEPPPYPNHNMGPLPYESWRGAPPINPPGGVWYRGPPGPPPYGGPGAPGGFPMEPFPYYRPQVPPPGLANSQPIPPVAGPHGHHPKNGDMYRPPMPDSYMRPSMPMRPGFYPGPIPYEGYYGPPMGFCNPNERDLSFMGMPPGPPIYNRPVNQNCHDPNNSRPKSREHRGPEQVEPVLNDPRGNYKVLMKHNDSWNQNEEERWNHRMNTSASNRDKGILSRSSVPENAWADDYKKDRDMHDGKGVPAEEFPSQTVQNNFASTDHATRFPVSNVNETDRSHVTENAASPRNQSLIQKIEGLNAKARASGGRQDGFHREQSHDKVHIVNAKGNQSGNDATSDVLQGRHYTPGVIPGAEDINNATVEKTRESVVSGVTATTSRPTRGVQSRGDHQGKGRFNGQEADGRIRKSESHTVVSAAVSGTTTNDEVKEHHPVLQPAEVPEPDVERKDDRASVVSTFDHSDTQRAKMREIAKQRAIQLQKEEEERTREQKAKALAKLEELNRRSANQGMDNQSQKLESVPSHSAVSHKQEDSKNHPEPNLDANQTTESGLVSSNNIGQTNEINSSHTVDSTVSHSYGGAVTKKNADKDYVLSQNQLEAADPKFNDAIGHRTSPAQVREASKQKCVAHKQRQNIPSQKSSMQESTPAFRADAPKNQDGIAPAEEGCCILAASAAGKELTELPLTSDSPLHQKKKNNKNGKNKHKVEESSNAISSSEAMPKDSRVAQDCADDSGKNASDFVNWSSHSSTDAKDAVQSFENHSLLSREDVHVRQSNSWKPQHSRKTRSSQNNRISERSHSNDAVVWAPVRSSNKVDVTEQTSEKTAEPSVPSETGNNLSRNGSKTKRAEMERYVPKPVAKELAQQGNTQQSPSTDLGGTEGTGGTSKTPQGSESSDYAAKAGSVAEAKHVDGRHKQQKAQGSWRQRVSVQSTPVQSSRDNSSAIANMSNNVKSNESQVGGAPSGPDVLSDKGPQASMCDGWDCANDRTSTSSAVFSDMKVHAPSGRGKRHPSKGYKSSGYNQNFDCKDSNAAFTDSQCPPGTIQVERIASPRDNRVVGDRSTSQWQPKSQGQQGNRHRGGQDVTGEDSRGPKRGTGHNCVETDSEDKHVDGGIPRLGNEDSERDRKGLSIKGHPNQGSVIAVESALSGATDGLNEQRPFSGYRKNANYGGRPNRHESRGDWSSTSQENKQHYSSANRERQMQNSHYEYQAIGPYNSNTRRSNELGAQKDNQAGGGGQRFRERGNNYSRRGKGNFYGRQSGNPSDAAGY